ncbi:MAG TPA: hypothetical protein PKL85_05950, partial [Bacteroidia bacterium]|nr:hypothetical protein [Bacteroidia bacterium]
MYTTFQKPITGSIQVFIFLLSVFISVNANAATKTAATSGTWATGGNWSPSGAPAAGDSVIIPNGKTMNIGANTSVASIYVATGGAITFSGNKSLTMTQSLTVNGTFTMNNTNISFASGKSFTLGAGSSFTWDPQTNNAANATLFTNGVENFSATSSLIINEWYDYTLPIGSVVTGNFGNLRLNSLNGGSIYEWRQQNYFSTHVIQGTLTVDQGWIVLDKSGAISSTTIGNIVLLNANSYLDCHGGTHSGSFTVNTTNLTITDGMMTGIYNGNGNVTLNVTGTATLNGAGILSLVMNSGVANVGNGNGTLNVTGNFVQNKGGFYGIYNGTTTNAGVCNVTITGNLTYTGGDFMVHAGCHTGTSTSSLSVGGNTTITYTSATDAFWIVGLSSVGATNNSVKLNWKNNGNVTISGNAGGEFTGSAGSGAETDSILGNLSVAGGTNAFNWPGATAQSHTTTVYTGGTTTVSGGELTYSYFGGSLTGTLAGNVSVTGGTMIVKRESGAATMNLSGSFTQSAGTVYLHNNSSTYTPNAVNVTVDGNFTQSGGTINYDNNTSGSSAQHSITLNGSNYTLSGSGAITRTDAAANTIFGMLYFNRAGTTTMSRSGSSHLITQVKQTINNGTTLNVSSGNLQISNHSIASTSYLRVASGGTLIMNSNRIYAAGSGTKTGMQVDASGTLKTTNTYGFYDNTSNATVDPGSS